MLDMKPNGNNKYSHLEISVVVISRNEERNIASCLESILIAVEDFNHEIILVDSASTDKTIELAKTYPITILQLKPEWFLSASAGRYIGSLHARGKYIQFLDGDTILDADWFKHAIPYFKDHPSLGGITGLVSQEEYDNIVAKSLVEVSKNEKVGDIDFFHAVILLRKDLLGDVGSFNPYLKAIEEGEFSYRILAGGYNLVRLPHKIGHHLGSYDENIISMVMTKQQFAKVCGQIFRYSVNNKKILIMYWADYKYIILFSLLILYGIPSLFLFFAGIDIFMYLFFIGFGFLFFYIVYDKKSINYAIKHIIGIFIRCPYFLKGIFSKPLNIGDYPTDVKIIIRNKGK